nr:light-inducible protein CPRF2-like isoform X2 [Ipomoea trifida]GLL29735.1 light-inducible protein CPRF2-like isoform X2 [Ipomoea trifida]
MKAENSYLWEHVTEISLKLNNALADKKILEADNETLRAKVMMAEETVRRMQGEGSCLENLPNCTSGINSNSLHDEKQ